MSQTTNWGVSQTNILNLWSILKFTTYGNLEKASPLKLTIQLEFHEIISVANICVPSCL